jgi:hypothetical protein
LYHHLVYGIEAVAEGKLLDSVIGKRNVWLAKKQLLEKKIFPKIAFDEYLDPKVKLVIAEGQRFMENGAFTGVRVIRKVLF